MMSLNELDDLVRHVEARNLAKCVARGATLYRVAADGVTIEKWDGLSETWGTLQTFNSKAARERWERSGETRDSFVPHNGLTRLASPPWSARVARLERVAGTAHHIDVKEGPSWRHAGRFLAAGAAEAVRALADDEATIIDTDGESLRRLLQEAATLCGAAPEVHTPEVVAPVAAAAPAYAPGEVTAQYRRAVAGCLEMIRFGAMMMEIEAGLDKSRHLPDGSGDSLKAWLAEHCPEINYKSAIRFKGLAEGLRFHCRVPQGWPLRLALPSPDGGAAASPEEAREVGAKPQRLAQMRREIWSFLEGKSARQLLFDFGEAGDGPKGGDRRSGLRMTEEEKHARAIERAKRIWIGHLDDLAGEARTVGSLLLFDAGLLDAILLKLDVVRDAVKAARGGMRE